MIDRAKEEEKEEEKENVCRMFMMRPFNIGLSHAVADIVEQLETRREASMKSKTRKTRVCHRLLQISLSAADGLVCTVLTT